MVVCAQVTVLPGCGASCVQVGCGFYPERVHWKGQEEGGPSTHIPVGVVGQRALHTEASAHRGLCTQRVLHTGGSAHRGLSSSPARNSALVLRMELPGPQTL